MLCDEDAQDNAVELTYLATKNIYGLNKLNSYSFAIPLPTASPLYLSAYGRGNILMKINANHTYHPTPNECPLYKANVAQSLNSCDGRTPFILFYTTQDIAPGEELLFDYGKLYWSCHDNNNDVSNPDAKIYRNLLTTNKYLDQAASIRFIRLIKEHDDNLYKNLLEHITTPFKPFSGKDRLVECRKIHSPSNKSIDYRIYKLPGESAIGEPSQDYFSVSLAQLDQYRWCGAQ
ncbi:SET domain-containing protein-lysine N-methyltransferase [Cardinium endosymbiont of Nabis limbatus]|uniref:SET domain-containing protein-lysine N-methyltransferase n=1 Tax=Cardinium endosymbiont of Nabis limbatus TaxID=3066217 RepID=UPI003AF3525D